MHRFGEFTHDITFSRGSVGCCRHLFCADGRLGVWVMDVTEDLLLSLVSVLMDKSRMDLSSVIGSGMKDDKTSCWFSSTVLSLLLT
jgi:hypothetical protein